MLLSDKICWHQKLWGTPFEENDSEQSFEMTKWQKNRGHSLSYRGLEEANRVELQETHWVKKWKWEVHKLRRTGNKKQQVYLI